MKNLTKRAISLFCCAAVTFSTMGIDNPVLADDVNTKETNEKWTIGMYMCGSNLESDAGLASKDIVEILNANVSDDFNEKVNIVIETGGALIWNFKENYEKFLEEKGLSETEIENMDIQEIDARKIQLYKVNFEHEYVTDEGKTETVPAIEFIKDVADYPSYDDEDADYESYGILSESTDDNDTVDIDNVDNVDNGDIDLTDIDSFVLEGYMNDYYILSAFFNELDNNYSAEHMMVDFWNHGGGVTGGVCYDDYSGLPITITLLNTVLNEREEAGYKDLDILGFDACLMSGYEIWMNIGEYADMGVGSILSEPGEGWYYTPFIEDLSNNIDNDSYSSKEFAASIVDAYASFYDNYERDYVEDDVTLCAVDLKKLLDTKLSFDNISKLLLQVPDGDAFIQNVFAEASVSGLVEMGTGVTSLNNFLDVVKEMANEKAESMQTSLKAYEYNLSWKYGLCGSEASYMKELLSESIVKEYTKCQCEDCIDRGAISIFCPDAYMYAFQDSVYNVFTYPNVAVSEFYASIVSKYAKMREDIQTEGYYVDYAYDKANGNFSISIPEEVSIYDGRFQCEKYIIKNGNNYYLGTDRYMNKSKVEVPDTLTYMDLAGVPVYAEQSEYGVENEYVIYGSLNGKEGIFCVVLDDAKENCYMTSFISYEDLYNDESDEDIDNTENAEEKAHRRLMQIKNNKEELNYDELSDEELKQLMIDDGFVFDLNPGDVISILNVKVDQIDYRSFEIADTAENVEAIENMYGKVSYTISGKDYNEGSVFGEPISGYTPGIKYVTANDDEATYILSNLHTELLDLEYDENLGYMNLDYVPDYRIINLGRVKAFADAKITVENNEYALTGEAITPGISFEGYDFVEGVDYELYYENNIGTGIATVYVYGLGDLDFLPSRSTEFKIIKDTNDKGETVYITKYIAIKTPKIKSTKNVKKKSIKVKWNKVKGADGYQVVYALNKKFTKKKKVKNVKKNSLKISKLKKNKKYFVKVRAYVYDENGKKIYGEFSKIKKVKIKK